MFRETEILQSGSQVLPSGVPGQSEGKGQSPLGGASGDLIINVGPQHPATHGVLHLVITLNGETIRKVEPHLGYIHRVLQDAEVLH